LGGADGIREYCGTKSIVAERVTAKREPNWYPDSPRKGRVLEVISRLLTAKDWRRRLGRRNSQWALKI
jgi:hypothetical protein